MFYIEIARCGLNLLLYLCSFNRNSMLSPIDYLLNIVFNNHTEQFKYKDA